MSRTHDTIISSFDLDQLERELEDARELAAKYEDRYFDTKEQRDRLAEALKKIQGLKLVAVDVFYEIYQIDEIVNEALAAVKGGSDDN